MPTTNSNPSLLIPANHTVTPGKMYLRLRHGRKDPDQEMEERGFDGPTFGPLAGVVQIYRSTIRIYAENRRDELWLPTHDDMIRWDGCYYGDLEIFIAPPNRQTAACF